MGGSTYLLSCRGVALDSGRVANVLVVAATVGVLHRVHGHTSDLESGWVGGWVGDRCVCGKEEEQGVGMRCCGWLGGRWVGRYGNLIELLNVVHGGRWVGGWEDSLCV